jgi:hypothetical protein
MFEEIGRMLDDLIESALIWNRHHWWYREIYCTIVLLIMNYQKKLDKQQVNRLHEFGYMSNWLYKKWWKV